MLMLLAVAFMALWWGGRRLRGRAWSISLRLSVLGVALLLRLLLLPLPPSLSHDALRYVWDGKVAVAGQNPYVVPPDDPRLERLRDESWNDLAHRQVPAIYPPIALVTFTLSALTARPLLALKLILIAADLATCALLIWIAERLKLGPERALWYAWNPLVVLEVAGMGHVDALAVVFAVAAVALLMRRPRRYRLAAVAAAAGILAKLAPLVALPAWVRGSKRPWRFLAATGAVLGAGLAPLVLSVGGVPPAWRTYAVSWEFNGPLFEPLWRSMAVLHVSAGVKRLLDALKVFIGKPDPWNAIYPYVYPQLLAKVVLLALFAGFLTASLKRRNLIAATGTVFGGMLLCSATVYPWYLLWVLPWAALARRRAWLLLSATIPLSYLPQLGVVDGLVPWVFLAIWIPFWIALWREPTWSSV